MLTPEWRRGAASVCRKDESGNLWFAVVATVTGIIAVRLNECWLFVCLRFDVFGWISHQLA